MTTKPLVLVVCKIAPILEEFLIEKGFQIEFDTSFQQKGFIDKIQQYEGIVTSTKITFDKPHLDAAISLKWIARMGSGMEQIDVEYAQKKGIHCFSSPDGNANAVAEQALGMCLSLQHNIAKSNNELKEGIWLRDANRGLEIEGKTAGIIGLGNNGLKFAQKLALLGVNVLGYDIEEKQNLSNNIRQVADLATIFEFADMISFHVPYNATTHHYFDKTFLNSMKQQFVILNLSRGKIVAQTAVLEGLKSGKIIGAALDVWEKEPISDMSDDMTAVAMDLLHHPNFIGTSHIGGYTFEAIVKMSNSLKEKLAFII